MLSQLRNRSRSDLRSHPIQVPGRNTKARSLIDFYNQRALQKSSVVLSKPIHDRHRVPSDKVRSLVQNFSRAASAATSGGGISSRGRGGMVRNSTNSPIAFRNGGMMRDGTSSPVAFRNGAISPVALRGQVELPIVRNDLGQKTGYHPQNTNTELRTVKTWKPARPRKLEKSMTMLEADEPMARKPIRGKTSRHTSVKNIVDSSEEPMPPRLIQPLTAPRLKALESEIIRSSLLETEISASAGDIISDGELVSSQTSESSSKRFREQNKIRIEVKITDMERKAADTQLKVRDTTAMGSNLEKEIMAPQAPSTVSKRSGSWKGALKTVRDSFRKKPTTAESSLSIKLSDEPAPSPEPKVIKSLIDNLTPDSPATSYLTAPKSFWGCVQGSISNIQAQVQKLQMLETVASEPENENTLPNDTNTQKNLSKLAVDRVLQGVSGSSLSRLAEDPNTISGIGEMVSWDSTVARQKMRARTYRTAPKQRAGHRPVVGVFKSPPQGRESPLKPISPLRVVEEKTQTIQETSEAITVINPAKSEPGALLNRVSMDTLTSFKELSLPNSLGSSGEVQQEETQSGKKLTVVLSTFESLSYLATPPPAKPHQEVRSPTLMREMAFPSLRLRAHSGDASMEKKYFLEDTPETARPTPKRQETMEHNSAPKKRIFGDADWRTDRNVNRNGGTSDISQKLQLKEGSPSSYDSQRTNSASRVHESNFTALPWQNYVPIPDASDSGDEYRDMIEREAPFLKYIVNPPLPAGAPPPTYLPCQRYRKFTSRRLFDGTSVIEVGADGQDEVITRGRRRTGVGS